MWFPQGQRSGFGNDTEAFNAMVIDNKHKILIGLALILAAMLTYRAVNPFRQPTVSKLTYGRTSKIISPGPKVAAGHTLGRPTKIKTDLLGPPPPLDLKVYRDPFRRPQQAKAVPPPKPDIRPTAPRIPTPEEQAREALRRFKAFGSFRQDDRASLFLQRGKQVLIVNVGDRIDGKFTIEAIDGRTVVVSTSEMTAPFQFEFEELKPDDDRRAGPASGSAARATPRPSLETPSANEPEPPPPEANDRITSENEEENPIPPLPEPPPVDDPAPPPSSKGSPSRNYLPGNKPPE